MVKRIASPHYDCILFDMDGVLVDSIELWIDVGLKGLLEQNVTTCTREDMIKAIVKFETLQKHGIADLALFGKRINELLVDRVLDIQLQRNILTTLTHLKKTGKRMGIITSSGRAAVDKILQNLIIAEFFDIVITFNDVAALKPDPEGIQKAIKYLDATPETTIMIGDTRNDILAGKRAGITTILYYPQIHEAIYDRDYLLGLGADYYIRDLQELIDIVN